MYVTVVAERQLIDSNLSNGMNATDIQQCNCFACKLSLKYAENLVIGFLLTGDTDVVRFSKSVRCE